MEFSEELCEEGGVLGLDRKNTKPPNFFGGADIGPANFTVTAIAGFLPSPEEGASTFVDSFNDASGEQASTHGMSKHSGEDRVDKKEAPSNRKASAAPARKPHVAFGHDRRKISETKLVRGEGETKVGLREG
jgi:hypothetical protein